MALTLLKVRVSISIKMLFYEIGKYFFRSMGHEFQSGGLLHLDTTGSIRSKHWIFVTSLSMSSFPCSHVGFHMKSDIVNKYEAYFLTWLIGGVPYY